MMKMEQCKTEPCIFRKKANHMVSLLVGVQHIHADDIIVMRENDVCDELYNELKERFCRVRYI